MVSSRRVALERRQIDGRAARELRTMAEGEAAGAGPLAGDLRVARSNAGKLGISLVLTWTIAIAVRIFMPRHLGPAAFGAYAFADGLAANAMGFLTLGVDTYTLREEPLRPRHANEYFWGVTLFRLAIAVAVLVVGIPLLAASGQSEQIQHLTIVFGAGYLVAQIAGSLAASLQANTIVDLVAVANVATKVAWGGLVAAALLGGAPLEALAGAMLVSELLKGALLYRESRRRVGLRWRLDPGVTRVVLAASLPFYANSLIRVMNRLDLAALGFLAGEQEVGWYGAAGMFYLLVLLLSPLMSSVYLPLLSRVRARSEADLWRVTSRTAETVLAVSIPLALFLALGADIWVRILFGEAFAPSALSLRATAPLAVLTYVASLLAMALFTIRRHWTVTVSSIVGTVASPLVAVACIPVGARLLGPGGAGAGAAMGAIAMEACIIAIQLRVVGLKAVGRGTVVLAARALAVGAAVTGAHVLMAPLGVWRLAVDAVLYVALGWPVGILPVRQMLALIRDVQQARREGLQRGQAD